MTRRRRRIAWFCGLAMASSWAVADCPNSKSTVVFKSSQGGSYLFYYLMGERTFRFTVEGKSFRMDTARIPGHALYEIDDKVLQLDRVDRKSFASFAQGTGEAETLEAQVRYEQQYVKTTAPQAKITNFGTRTRTDRDGKNPRLFRIWKFQAPEMQAQYLLTTLIDADTVAMISASMPGTDDDALDVLRAYALSLGSVSAADCDGIKWP